MSQAPSVVSKQQIARAADDLAALSDIEEIIEDARNGRMFILVDDEERENEGDLVIPAQMATPDAINFMAKHGRGLICLTLTSERIEELGLPPMARHNASRHQTAFTVSIEAREGVTTGISASDRARTVAVAIDASKSGDDIATPGHVFPLEARDGGVLVRTGHTEAAVDLARLAGLNPSGVICEIMNEDGTMARLPDLIAFAQRHGLKIGAIADLIAYRLRHDSIVEPIAETTFNSEYGGEFRMIVFRNKIHYAEHIALVKGDITTGGPVLARMHAMSVLDDVLGDARSGKASDLANAMRVIADEGRGVIVLVRPANPTMVSDRIRETAAEAPPERSALRDYGVGAQILLALGVRDITLLSNTERTIVGLDGYGISIAGQRPVTPAPGA
ncbi:MAG: 3,4-dihydroxy-2-butanone-4-phosphate synthase [Rhodospirillales bacterium]